MTNAVTISEQLCFLLVVHNGSKASDSSVNSYELIRSLSRLFEIIEAQPIADHLVATDCLTVKMEGLFYHYQLTATGIVMLKAYKSQLYRLLEDEGHLTGKHGCEMTHHFIAKI